LGEVLSVRYIYILSLVILVSVATTASAGYREIFEKEFLSKPWSTDIVAESSCIECHTSEVMDEKLRSIPQDWRVSWHAQNNVSCHDCHGGDSEDASMAMSHKRGFTGSPKYTDIPEMCGKCHIGILKNYVESGHGKALIEEGTGPNCITCHGSHNVQKVHIDIINAQLCSKCHPYERAKIMKQALFLTDKKIESIEDDLADLRKQGVYPDREEKSLFNTQAQFRTLFHTIDVAVVKDKTNFFTSELNGIEDEIKATFEELSFRKKFSTFLMLIFAGSWAIITLIIRSKD
jgi:mono/diheme cytochrome c family protein